MALIKTSTGFEADIAEESLDDMEFVDALVELENGSFNGYDTVCRKLLGPSGKTDLYNHVRVDGRVPIKAFTQELIELVNGLRSQKK